MEHGKHMMLGMPMKGMPKKMGSKMMTSFKDVKKMKKMSRSMVAKKGKKKGKKYA